MARMDPASDEVLLSAWRGGDRRAGSELLRRHFVDVTRFFQRRIDAAATEDLVQQTFMGAVQAHERLPEGVGFKVYLFGIARKQLLMHLRREGRRSRVQTSHASIEDQAVGSSLAPSRVVAAREQWRVLLRAIRGLPEERQAALELFYFDDLRATDIAQILDRPVGTIKAWLSRSRAQLRDAVAKLQLPVALAESTLAVLRKRDGHIGADAE